MRSRFLLFFISFCCSVCSSFSTFCKKNRFPTTSIFQHHFQTSPPRYVAAGALPPPPPSLLYPPPSTRAASLPLCRCCCCCCFPLLLLPLLSPEEEAEEKSLSSRFFLRLPFLLVLLPPPLPFPLSLSFRLLFLESRHLLRDLLTPRQTSSARKKASAVGYRTRTSHAAVILIHLFFRFCDFFSVLVFGFGFLLLQRHLSLSLKTKVGLRKVARAPGETKFKNSYQLASYIDEPETKKDFG